MKILLPSLILIYFTSSLFAQRSLPLDSLPGDSSIHFALELLERQQEDSSFIYFNKGLKLFEKANNLKGWILAHRQLGVFYRNNQKDFSAALNMFSKATEEMLPRLPTTKSEWRTLGWLYAQIAFTLTRSDSDDSWRKAADWYEKAAYTLEEKAEEDPELIAEYVLHDLANIFTRFDEHRAAELIFQRIISIIGDQNSSFAAEVFSDLGIMYHYNNKNYEKAKKYFKKGLRIENIPLTQRALIESNLPLPLFAQGKLDSALFYANSAIDHFQQIKSDSRAPRWLANTYIQKSRILCVQERFEQAKEALNKAKIIFDTTSGPPRETAKWYIEYAKVFSAENQLTKSLEAYQNALKTVLYRFQPKNIHDFPSPDLFYTETTIIEALTGKAEVYTLISQQQDEVLSLPRAVKCHDLVFEVERLLRQTQYFESSKLFSLELSRIRSEAAIEAALNLYQLTNAPEDKEQAFFFAEKSKSILLLEALLESKVSNSKNIPDSLIQKERMINAHISVLEEGLFRLKNQPNSTLQVKRDSINEQILNLKRSLNELNNYFKSLDPNFLAIKSGFQLVDIKELQKRIIDPDQAIIEYFVGNRNLFAFVIPSKGEIKVISSPKTSSLEAQVDSFRQQIERFQFEKNESAGPLCQSYTRLGRSLYQQLITPLGQLPKRLIIIPSGILGYLPFDALLYEAPNQMCRFKNYPFWIHQKQLSYNYSANLLWELHNPVDEKASSFFFGMAPNFDGRQGWPSTNYTKESLIMVNEMLKGKCIFDEDATINTFKALAPAYQIIHLATHAQANTEEGDFSFIVFAHEQGYDSLFVKSLYNIPLKAELVVLSACETGVGNLQLGEGIISLARSFLYAGARSVVTTLWQVNDRSTKEISVDFYNYLQTGSTSEEALHKAKVDQIDKCSMDYLAHPVYWAASVPMGNNKIIFSQTSYWPFVLKVFVSAILIFFLLGLWKKWKG